MEGKRLKTVNGEILLPEAMIQNIQSFLSGKEAAQTTLLSKSWYNAWLTRPALHFDQCDFKNLDPNSSKITYSGFTKFVTKTMERYQGLNLKIDSFTLRMQSCRSRTKLLANKLILDALKMGATDLDLEWCSSTFVLPSEVLGSNTLLRLSVSGPEIDGNLNCRWLKSLRIDGVDVEIDDMIRDILSCCVSIEELSFSKCNNLILSRRNLYKHRNLRRLYLEMVVVDGLFFSDLASRFPCLKDLSVVRCRGYKRIHIGSTSLERISFVQLTLLKAAFDVPNIRKFCYSGMTVPSFYIGAREREWEWESHISFAWDRSQTRSWFTRLREFLTRLRPSKITLSLNIPRSCGFYERGDIQLMPKPVVVENLTIEADDSCYSCCDLLVQLFGVCRPKLITHSWIPAWSKDWSANDDILDTLCKTLMHEAIRPNCFIPDQNLFGKFDLKEVNVELYQEFILRDQRPLPFALKKPSTTPVNNQKVRFQLRWG